MRLKDFRPSNIAIMILVIALACVIQVAMIDTALAQSSSNASWKGVEQAMGRSGTLMPDGVFRFNIPRSDLDVKIGNVTVEPALALGSWIGFKDTGNGSVAMGDLVLTGDEVNAVMLRLQQRGIEQTALHNHLLIESPRVMYMHIMGSGDPVALAEAIHDALALTKTPANASKIVKPTNSDLDTAMLNTTIGVKGKYNGNVYQLSIPRKERIVAAGIELTPALGVATGINFQPLGNGNAAIAGDFVLMGTEVNPVILALRENNINVTAIHNHMIFEEPRLFFLHIWATGNQSKLAIGLKEALDKTYVFSYSALS